MLTLLYIHVMTEQFFIMKYLMVITTRDSDYIFTVYTVKFELIYIKLFVARRQISISKAAAGCQDDTRPDRQDFVYFMRQLCTPDVS